MKSFKSERHIWFFAGLLVACVFNTSAFAQDLNALKAGVVKITNKTGQVGTGFIVRVEPEIVYIVTAAHVIAGDQQPTIEFFSKNTVLGGQAPAKGSVLPGAQVGDDQRGLAVVIVRGKERIPHQVRALVFELEAQLVSGGEQALLIGHPGGGGDWAVVKRNISNRVVHDITMDPGMASRFSGGPILVNGKVVGMVMTNRGEFGFGVTHKSLLNYLEGIGIEAGSEIDRDKGAMQTQIGKKDGPPMVVIQPGSFKMGDWLGRGDKDERPVHEVRFPRDFAIGKYEVTFAEYDAFAQATGRVLPDDKGWGRDRRPVINVSWEDAKAYAQWLSDQTGNRYRLPTEAEWEFAARSGGKQEQWAGTSDESQVGNFAVSIDNSGRKTAEVGSKQPNGFGLYDMSGNVIEWVEDCWHENYQGAPTDGSAWLKAAGGECGRRVVRGGSWFNVPGNLHLSIRGRLNIDDRDNFVGFRLAQVAP